MKEQQAYDNFTGTSELWFDNQNTDTIKFAGGADTVAHVIQSARDDYEEMKKQCAPGVELAPQSQTFWFD